MRWHQSIIHGFLRVLILLWASDAGGESARDYGTPRAPLHRAHNDVACERCHTGQGEAPDRKCLSCHSAIHDKQQAGRGLHAQPEVRGQTCARCHREHRGRDADLRGLSRLQSRQTGRFDHALTGFDLSLVRQHELSDAGTPRECTDCHRERTAAGQVVYADNARGCKPCHADFHAGSRLTDCVSCHPQRRRPAVAGSSDLPPRAGASQPLVDARSSQTAWWVERFDHRAQTRFPLDGRHARGAKPGRCIICHPTPRAPKDFSQDLACGSPTCHQKDDRHDGRWPQCETCHQPSRFADVATSGPRPEHRQSPDPLGGAHDRVPCQTCHGSPQRPLRGMSGQCISCHQRDDIHHNALGPRCGDCHTQQSFAGSRFNHATVGCMLRGIHRTLPCADCHKGGNYAGLSPMCISCHRDDAMRAAGAGNTAVALHAGQTACTHCHNTLSFRQGLASRPSPPESVCQ